jgi:uncharacterized protein (DUF4415 family)
LPKVGAWLPYRRARRFLSEFFPLGADLPCHETIRRRTARVRAGIEREVVSRAKSPRPAPPSDTITVSIDAGHVRTARGHQGRTFEVMAARVSNDDVEPVLFSGLSGEADQQHTQLNGVLTGLGMTETEVTILSDGADGPRSLGEAASTRTVYPDDAPELTAGMLADAEVFEGNTFVRRGRGRPKAAAKKEQISVRLDPDILAVLRAEGPVGNHKSTSCSAGRCNPGSDRQNASPDLVTALNVHPLVRSTS